MFEFDAIFDSIGHFGLFQWMVLLLAGILAIGTGIQVASINFFTYGQPHFCSIDRLKDYSYVYQKYVAIPYNEEAGDYEQCLMFDYSWDNVSDDMLDNWNRSFIQDAEVIECNTWIHDRSIFRENMVTEWDLVCDRTYLVALTSAIILGSQNLGCILSGFISDRFGRVLTISVSLVLVVPFALGGMFFANFAAFVFSRFAVLMLTTAFYICSFVLDMELMGPKVRVTVGMTFPTFFAIGIMVTSGMAYSIRDFRVLQIVYLVPLFVGFAYYWLIPEPPRWLISQNCGEEAIKNLKCIAQINKTSLPEYYIQSIREQTAGSDSNEDTGSFADLFRHPFMRKISILQIFIWFSCAMVYWALNINTASLYGDIFLNTFLTGAFEIPAAPIGIVCLMKAGRRPTLVVSSIIAGLTLLLCMPFVENEELGWLVTTLTMLAKTGITVTYNAMFLYTSELYPTVIRQVALGLMAMVGTASTLFAPYYGAPMQNIWMPLPSLILGLFSIVSGLLILGLPETLNRNLPDTMEDAINLSKGKSEEYVGEVHLNAGFTERDKETTMDNIASTTL